MNMTLEAREGNEPFNNVGHIMVNSKDLPLSCPLPEMNVWNAHPRVYLPIEKTGKVNCPYCSAQYILTSLEDNKE